MGEKIKFKRINLAFVEKQYPLLFNSIEAIGGLNDLQKEFIAGLSVQIMMDAGGTPEMFQDELDTLFIDEEI